MNLLGRVLSGFFLATALFGVVIFCYSFPIQNEIADLADTLGYKGNFFYNEMWGFRVAMVFGIGSFFLVFLIWIRFWRHRCQQVIEENQPNESNQANQS